MATIGQLLRDELGLEAIRPGRCVMWNASTTGATARWLYVADDDDQAVTLALGSGLDDAQIKAVAQLRAGDNGSLLFVRARTLLYTDGKPSRESDLTEAELVNRIRSAKFGNLPFDAPKPGGAQDRKPRGPHLILFVNVAVLTSYAAQLAGHGRQAPVSISRESVALIVRLADKISRATRREMKLVITSPSRRSRPSEPDALRQALEEAGVPAHRFHADWMLPNLAEGPSHFDGVDAWCAAHGEVDGIIIDAEEYTGSIDLGKCTVDPVEGVRVRDYCDVLDGLGIEDEGFTTPPAPPEGQGITLSPHVVERCSKAASQANPAQAVGTKQAQIGFGKVRVTSPQPDAETLERLRRAEEALAARPKGPGWAL